MELLFVLSLVVAAAICGVLWRRPDARAVAAGAWQAGKAQAVYEFREGYEFAQQRLRAGDPSWRNPRRWTSWLLAGVYGLVTTLAAANRIRREAWQGARARYEEWKAAQPVDAEVVEEVVVGPGAPSPAAEPNPEDAPEPPPSAPEQTADAPPNPGLQPETQQEEPEVQTEATGLTSYANAHQQFATELRSQMSGSENLAASMKDVLSEHSDLIGDTAVLQDLLNQAAGIAERIAERSMAVANN